MRVLYRLWALRMGLFLGLAGCTATGTDPSPGAPGGPSGPTGPQGPFEGAEVWMAQCAGCHGELGEGGVAPALSAWTRGRAALVTAVDATMPLGTPEACVGGCAEAVADYILTALQRQGPACEGVELLPRQLRLLTRREYQRTVEALLGAEAPVRACGGDEDCDVARESCQAGACQADPCGRHTFLFDPGAARPGAVVVAGSFNGWAPTEAQGGWPMRWVPALGRYLLKRDLADGRHSYKLVVDGAQWVADPTNPTSEPDGYGGVNSVLEVACGGSGGAPSPGLAGLVDAFPVESRPQDYPFDNAAEAGLVTSVHLTEYMAAAQRLADVVLAEPARHLGCAPAEAGCLQDGLRRLGGRALRRPLTEEEVAGLVAVARAEADPQDGLRVALRILFASPSFLYRSEVGTPVGDGTYRLTGPEVASALAYLFWGAGPDDALLAAAAAGELDTAEGRVRAAERLLADPRARTQVGDFAVEWLGIGGILEAEKRAELFPGFDAAVRAAALAETRRLVEDVVFDAQGGLPALYTADHTFVDARLAAYYGLEAPAGGAVGRVPYRGRRAGVLSHASVLATYAHSDQTSPVKRGVFVRQRVLCQKFGVPPANAGGVPEVDPGATTRERFSQHSDDPVCRSCHRFIDGLGFGFERFDAAGAYREVENGQPVDPSGVLEDLEGFGAGTRAEFGTLPELAALLADSRAARRCFVTQYWRFGHGRLERPADACAIDGLLADFVDGGLDVRALMLALVRTDAFVLRK
jgi:hypothetical protein